MKAGEILLEMNGQQIADIFDYYYLADDAQIDLITMLPDQTQKSYHIVKEEQEELGFIFENGLLDEYHSWSNFCALIRLVACLCAIVHIQTKMMSNAASVPTTMLLTFWRK